jgi:hypothetical protein
MSLSLTAILYDDVTQHHSYLQRSQHTKARVDSRLFWAKEAGPATHSEANSIRTILTVKRTTERNADEEQIHTCV